MSIKINTLKSLETVKDIYEITDDLQIVNTATGYVKKLWKNKGGYPMVSLETICSGCPINVPMHKIVALAFIENKEFYSLIEHLNDNKEDFSINNLKFSNHVDNGKRAFVNGCVNRNENLYKIILNNGSIMIDTIKNLSNALHIAKNTLYDNVYVNRKPTKFRSIELYKCENDIKK